MSKILVTGGAGFIGSNICDFLINNNHQVVVLDNLSTGNKNNIEHLLNHPNFQFIYGDICNLEIVRKSCYGVNMICHQAALGSVPRSINDPLSSHNSNVNGFLNILLVAKELNIKRIVYASSSSVYGDSEILPKKEDEIGAQLSPYAITKYIDELYANNFSKLFGLECIGLRYFNVFGPRQAKNDAYSAVIPVFVKSMLENKSPVIYGDGNFSRDFTYIDNVVSANYLALTTNNEKCYGQVFNVACGGQIAIIHLFNSIKKHLNCIIDPIHAHIRKGDVPHSKANIQKIKEYLNYSVLVDFETGIIKTIEYYKNI